MSIFKLMVLWVDRKIDGLRVGMYSWCPWDL